MGAANVRRTNARLVCAVNGTQFTEDDLVQNAMDVHVGRNTRFDVNFYDGIIY